jgi:hypothetical protein
MEYFEYAYLLHVAHFIRSKELEAKKDGEEFHPSSVFIPLKSGIEAQARIVEMPVGPSPVLVLRIRSKEDPEEEAKKFFHGKYEKVPWDKEHVYISNDIPEEPMKPP